MARLQLLGSTQSVHVQTFVRTALLTGMRYSEILGLTWGRVDIERRIITVGTSKTAAGSGRQIPMNSDLFSLLSIHRDWWAERFGMPEPHLFLFPFGSPRPEDPTRPATTLKTAWETVRKRAGISCRFHDLRHTVATKMAEAGVPESTMLALLGHMSRSMLERYSHVRLTAKRDAVESLSVRPNSEAVPPKSPSHADTPLSNSCK
jgi:integrase